MKSNFIIIRQFLYHCLHSLLLKHLAEHVEQCMKDTTDSNVNIYQQKDSPQQQDSSYVITILPNNKYLPKTPIFPKTNMKLSIFCRLECRFIDFYIIRQYVEHKPVTSDIPLQTWTEFRAHMLRNFIGNPERSWNP